MTTKQIRQAFDTLSGVFYSAWTNYAEVLLKQCKEEEKGHRGWGPDFTRHHPSAISVIDAAKLFAVREVAEYILHSDKAPKGRDYLHCKKSCFLAAGIADEYGEKISTAWGLDGFTLGDLAALDYCEFVKVIKTEDCEVAA